MLRAVQTEGSAIHNSLLLGKSAINTSNNIMFEKGLSVFITSTRQEEIANMLDEQEKFVELVESTRVEAAKYDFDVVHLAPSPIERKILARMQSQNDEFDLKSEHTQELSRSSVDNRSRKAKSRLVCITSFVMNLWFFVFKDNILPMSDCNLDLQKQIRTKTNTMSIHEKGDRRILYLHVGKTGGTSLDKILRSNCEWYKKSKQTCLEEQAGVEVCPLTSLREQFMSISMQLIANIRLYFHNL